MLKSKKSLLFGVILVVVSIGLATSARLVRSFSSPSQGVIQTTIVPVAAKKLDPISTKGKTANFTRPAAFIELAPEKLATGDIEKFSYLDQELTAWNLAIQIKKLPSGVLADDGGYNFRKHYPDRYTEEKLKINGLDVSIMSDQSGGYAKAAFMVHNGLVAYVALTSASSSNSTGLDEALHTVINSWQWL
jgi:hypothetical protein